MPFYVSASGIKLWRSCKRAAVLRYVYKAPQASKPSAQLGTDVHTQSEAYLRGWSFDYSTPRMKRAAEIALLGVPFLPPPGTPGMLIEGRRVEDPRGGGAEFRFGIESLPDVVFRGRKDLVVPNSVVIPGCAGGVPGVLDHKTSSNIAEYALSAEDLRTDEQGVIYAYDTMQQFRTPVADLAWNYLPTKGAKRAHPVRLRVYWGGVVEEFQKIEVSTSEMSATFQARPRPLDVAPPDDTTSDRSPCKAYGGCPFRTLICTDIQVKPNFGKVDYMNGNGTPQGHALLTQLVEQAAPAPVDQAAEYARYQAWVQAQQALVAPPAPAPVAPPVAAPLPPGISNAPPGYVPAPFLTAPSVPVAPTYVAPPAINPPEFQHAPAPGVPLVAAEKKARKPRATKEEMAARRAANGGVDTLADLLLEASDLLARIAEVVK